MEEEEEKALRKILLAFGQNLTKLEDRLLRVEMSDLAGKVVFRFLMAELARSDPSALGRVERQLKEYAKGDGFPAEIATDIFIEELLSLAKQCVIAGRE